ncbi:MAG: iron ABC transporter permease [Deltaproteobacteria bacterium]|nr:iron ABC transporter permease [Deltaproteobacteria bacterium]
MTASDQGLGRAIDFGSPPSGRERGIIARYFHAGPGRILFVSATAIAVALLVALPIVFLIVASFAVGRPGSIEALTLGNYFEVLREPRYWGVVGATLLVSLGSVVIAFGLGIPVAWLTTRYQPLGNRIWRSLAPTPLYVSPLVVAVGWDTLLNPSTGYLVRLTDGAFAGWDLYGPVGIAAVMGIYFSTYVYLYAAPSFATLDANLEDAARITGAPPFTVIRRVTVPLIAPSLLAVGILVVVLSTGLFSISAVLGWPVNFRLLPLEVYFSLSVPPVNYGSGLVMSVVTLFITTILLIGYYIATRHGHRYETIRGAALHARPARGRGRYFGAAYLAVYLILAIGIPLGTLFAIATTDFAGRWVGLEAFASVMNSRSFVTAAANTLIVAGAASLLTVLLGIAVAYTLKFRLLGRATVVLDYVVAYPLAIPGVVLGAGLLWMYLQVPGAVALYGTLGILVVACVIQHLAVTVRALVAGAGQLGGEMFDAASVAGASWFTRLTRIFVPPLGRHIYDTWVLTLVLSSRELAAILLLWNSVTITLPVLMFTVWREGTYRDLAAIGIIQTLLTIGVLLVAAQVRKSIWKERAGA